MIEGYWLSSEMTAGIFKMHQDLLPKIFDERRHISIEELLQVDTGNGKTTSLSDLKREKEEEEYSHGMKKLQDMEDTHFE
jgi:hypothetical protein